MAYGLLVQNADSRTQISSDESYEHMFIRAPLGTKAPGAYIGALGMDMLFVQPTGTGRFGLGIGSEETNLSSSSDTGVTGYWWSSYSEAAPALTGTYGLEVRNPAGSVTFDSRGLHDSFDILAAGTMLGSSSIGTLTIDLSLTGFSSSEIYCMINNTKLHNTEFVQIRSCYRKSGTTVFVDNYMTGQGIFEPDEPIISPTAVQDFTYVIVGYRG